jgi:hypothetical protein
MFPPHFVKLEVEAVVQKAVVEVLDFDKDR